MKKINIATVFSGIGSIESALENLKIPHNILFASDNGERYLENTYEEIISLMKKYKDDKIAEKLYEKMKKKNFVRESYEMNYKSDNWYEDVRFINGKKYKGEVDLYVGGSPCQSFSIIGKGAGFKDTRGTLFYDYARLISEMKPSVFVFENVKGIMSHDSGNTWKIIQEVFSSLGYYFDFKVLNTKEYGIPHNRPRVFVVGFKHKKYFNKFKWPEKKELSMKARDYYDEVVDKKYYLGEKGFKFVTSYPGNRTKVNSDIIKCQKAQQQFNWNGDFVFEEVNNKKEGDFIGKAYVGKYNGKLGVARKMTHKELLSLMGYSKSFKLTDNDTQAYRQIGNSISVNVSEELLKSIKGTGVYEK